MRKHPEKRGKTKKKKKKKKGGKKSPTTYETIKDRSSSINGNQYNKSSYTSKLLAHLILGQSFWGPARNWRDFSQEPYKLREIGGLDAVHPPQSAIEVSNNYLELEKSGKIYSNDGISRAEKSSKKRSNGNRELPLLTKVNSQNLTRIEDSGKFSSLSLRLIFYSFHILFTIFFYEIAWFTEIIACPSNWPIYTILLMVIYYSSSNNLYSNSFSVLLSLIFIVLCLMSDIPRSDNHASPNKKGHDSLSSSGLRTNISLLPPGSITGDGNTSPAFKGRGHPPKLATDSEPGDIPSQHRSHASPSEPKGHPISGAHIDVVAPELSDMEVAHYQATVLFGRVWGEYVPSDAIVTRMTKDWSTGKGGVSISYAYCGWFRITFDHAEDRDSIWEGRPWFVQGLNFVLKPWSPMFISHNQQITHVDQWVRIPFLPTEYWNTQHLTHIVSGIGTLVKFDKFTSHNSSVAQYARVCINIDITKQVPRFLKLNFQGMIYSFNLSYEGVHETCALCGSDSHHLRACPNRQNQCLEMIVAKLEASTLNSGETVDNSSVEWTTIMPKRRAKPSTKSYRPKKTGGKPNIPRDSKQSEGGIGSDNVLSEKVTMTNTFEELGKGKDLEEPIYLLNPAVTQAEKDFEHDFLLDIQAIHHSSLPEFEDPISGNALPAMETAISSNASGVESSKRRKRADESPSPSTTALNF